jgi:hypothetical protein
LQLTLDLRVRRPWQWHEPQRASRVLGKNASEHEGMEVHVQIDAPAEALDHRHGPTLPVPRTARLAAAVEAQEHANVDGEDGAAQANASR